jgi:hypothetical protein
VCNPENAGRDQAGRWTKGRSGNRAGKPRGVHNRATRLLDNMALADAAAVLRVVLDKAKGGDLVAAGHVLARLWPVRKARIAVELPELHRAADLPAAISAVIARVADASLSPEEGAQLSALLGAWRQAIELEKIEQRICDLERKAGNAPTEQ